MKYNLKELFAPVPFLKTVDRCAGEVVFESSTGDRLNLKSQLSKYLFLTVRPGDPSLKTSVIECTPEDGEALADFLVLSSAENG